MNYTIKEVKIVLIYLLIMVITIFLCFLSNNSEQKKQKNKVNAFNNNESLLCFDTLIVTNSNWKLYEDNLINNNSAGYIKIKNCKVIHEN